MSTTGWQQSSVQFLWRYRWTNFIVAKIQKKQQRQLHNIWATKRRVNPATSEVTCVPPDASSVLKYLLNSAKQHAKHSLLYVFVSVNWWCQRLWKLLKDILHQTNQVLTVKSINHMKHLSENVRVLSTLTKLI